MLVGKEKSNQRNPRRLFFKHIIRKVFLEDWAMKLVALAITLGLWLGVTFVNKGKQTSVHFPAVPLNFRVTDNAVVTDAQTQDVEITVRGVNENTEKIRRSDLIGYVDLTDLKPGEHVVTLTPEIASVPLPSGVVLVELWPSRIAVTIEAVKEKEIEVKVETEGTPPPGFEVYSESIVPQKVKVRGPASLVNSIDQLLTDKISLHGQREDFTARQIPVSVSNPKVTIFNTVVDVGFRIGEKRVEKTFLVPITSVPGKTVTAVLYGPRTILGRLRSTDLKAEIVKNEVGQDVPQFALPPELRDVIEVRKPKLN